MRIKQMIMHSNLSKMKNKIPQSVKKETTEKVWENSAIHYMVSRGGGVLPIFG